MNTLQQQFKKNILRSILAPTILLVLIAIPARASAATVYLEASRSAISVGDTVIVAVKVNADGAVLNTVDGNISIKSSSNSSPDINIQQFSLANSSFGLWPRTPSLSQDGKTISYVAGIPGGFSIEGATLFKIVVHATSTGTVTFTPVSTSVLANDGKGTKVPSQFKGLTLTITPQKAGALAINDWANIVSTDTIPPEPFIVVIGKDPALSNGKRFAYFSAIDNQSGIDHYQVSENGGPYVRSGSTYVLQDQSDAVKLTVVAYDKAGNVTTATYPATTTNKTVPQRSIPWVPIIVLVLSVGVIYVAYRKISRTSKNVSKNL